MLRPEQITRPAFAVPAGACDSHMHVFGAPDRYPPAAERVYTPAPAPFAAWRAMAARLGLTRVVFVQPSAYGTDNRAMLDALSEAGPDGRGIAVLDETAPKSVLDAMAKAGVRGLRLNVKTHGDSDTGALKRRVLQWADRIGPLQWHIQIFADLPMIAAIAEVIRTSPVPIVLDHMGGPRASLGLMQDGMKSLLDLLGGGRCWVKLSGAYRVSEREPEFADSVPIAAALAKANPEQVVWGTDWPHLGSHAAVPSDEAPPAIYRDLDAGALLNILAESVGSGDLLNRVLLTNPARLYGF